MSSRAAGTRYDPGILRRGADGECPGQAEMGDLTKPRLFKIGQVAKFAALHPLGAQLIHRSVTKPAPPACQLLRRLWGNGHTP